MHWLLFVLQYFLKILSQYPSLNTRGRQYTDFFNATFFRTAKGIGYLHCKYFKLNLLVNYNNNAYDITQYYSDTQWFRLRFWGQNLGLIHSDPHFEIHPSIQEYIKKTFMCMGNHSPPKITWQPILKPSGQSRQQLEESTVDGRNEYGQRIYLKDVAYMLTRK